MSSCVKCSYRLFVVQIAEVSVDRRGLAVLPRSSLTRRRHGVPPRPLQTARQPVDAETVSTARRSGTRFSGRRPPDCRQSPACCRTDDWTAPRDDSRHGVDHRPTGTYAVGRRRSARPSAGRRLRRRHLRRRRRRSATQPAVPSGPLPAARR